MEKIINYMKKNKKYILTIFSFTFIWGLIAHGYMFFNNNLTHDSFMESIATENVFRWKLSLGRLFYPLYLLLTRGILTLPWLIGILSLIFISIATILILKMFNIKENNHWMNILVPGILTVNTTVIALCGTYIHDMDVDMFAMLMSVLSVYLWRNYKKGYLYGAIPLLISFGLYQSYISVSISLIIFLSVFDLLNKENYYRVLKNGLLSIGMIILTGIFYLVLLKLMPILFNVNLISGNYNSVDTLLTMSLFNILKETIISYLVSIKNIILPVSIYNNVFVITIHLLLILSAGYVVIKKLFDKSLHNISKLMIILLLLLLPLAMNICRILTNGMSHTLMYYAIWLIYLLVLFILNEYKNNKLKVLSIVLILLIFIGNIRMANILYMTKAMAKEQTENYLSRVLHDIENYDNYIPGKTKVFITGMPDMKLNFDETTNQIRDLAGNSSDFALLTGEPERYRLYFSRVFYAKVNIVDIPFDSSTDLENINNMNAYPNENSIKYIKDVLVVKLG